MNKIKMKIKLISTKSGKTRWKLLKKDLILSSSTEYSTVYFAVRAAERHAEKMNIKVLKSKYAV